MSINRQTDAYKPHRELKEHEILMKNKVLDYSSPNSTILDIGCADGLFISEVAKELPKALVTGIDISSKLIAAANAKECQNCSFLVEDAEKFEPNKKFDLIIASGILSVFDNFELILNQWTSWLENTGRLIIFGRFNSSDVDVKVSFRNNYKKSDWEGGLTSYSIQTIGRFLDHLGLGYEFSKFIFSGDLPKSEDPIRTYTVKTEDGEKLVVNGANLIAEHFFLTINR
jgi:trans-aconitate methyltransferase